MMPSHQLSVQLDELLALPHETEWVSYEIMTHGFTPLPGGAALNYFKDISLAYPEGPRDPDLGVVNSWPSEGTTTKDCRTQTSRSDLTR